jgi:hypothetical protein
MAMDPTSAAEARERVAKWIEETRQIFALLPELTANDHHAGASAQKEVDKLHKDLEDLKRENHLLRLEKDEIAQAMGQIASEARDHAAPQPLRSIRARRPSARTGPAKPAEPARAAEAKAADPAKS